MTAVFGAIAAVASSSASFPLEVVRCVPRARAASAGQPRGLRPVVHGAAAVWRAGGAWATPLVPPPPPPAPRSAQAAMSSAVLRLR